MRRRALFASDASSEADIRPTLLGVVTLMFMLLFFLLATSSGQRLGTVALRLGSAADLAPLPHAGLVKDVRVRLSGHDVQLEFDVQTTDIAAASSTVERKSVRVAARDGRVDLAALLAAVEEVHRIDRSQTRAQLIPDDSTGMDVLFSVMDVLRGPPETPIFPRLTLSGSAG